MWLVSNMAQAIGYRDGGKLKSLLGVALVHALLGLALMFGLRAETTRSASDPLKLVNLREEAPPPPPVPEQPLVEPPKPAPEGAPSPPSLKAEASPLVFPPPQVRLEAKPLLAVAPVAGTGTSVAIGTGETAGPGTGTGGQGSGTGSGGNGMGKGGEAEGPAIRTRRIEGSFTSRDYPREASRAGAEGTTVARLVVGANGRVSECIVRASSGNEALDRTTCGIILNRFRFEPARNPSGDATTDVVEWEQNWSLRREGPEAAEAQCRAQADKIAERRTARALFFSCMAAAGWSRR
jgi:protein TonB